MNTNLRAMVDVDRLIHEPSRGVILAILYVVESADFLYLQRETGLTKGNLSVHLSKLEGAGYISIEKTYRGKVPLTLCHLTDKGREAFESYRKQLKGFVEGTNRL
jgi:DNA-binding MarR family transcriptional regulator